MLRIVATDVDGDGATVGTFPVYFTSINETDIFSIFATLTPVSDTNPRQFWTVTWSSAATAHSMMLGPEISFDFDDITVSDSGSYTTFVDPFPLTPITGSVNPLPIIEGQSYDYVGSEANDSFTFSCPSVPRGWVGSFVPHPLAFSAGGTAYGYGGDDSFSGNIGNDAFYGGVGNDTLSGEVGVDALFGGEGDDHLTVQDGSADTLDGGSGFDRANLYRSSSTTAVAFTFDPTSDVSQRLSDGTSIVDIEGLLLALGSGHDQVTMMLGPSVTGFQYVSFGEGLDRAVIDLTRFSTGLTVYEPWRGTNSFSVLGDQGELYRAEQVEVLNIRGGAGDDNFTAGTGNDILQGNNGTDTLYGGSGNDSLFGGAGNDLIEGGEGADALIGGAGSDTYIVDATGDRVFETTTTTSTIDAGGIDTVHSAVSFNLNATEGARFVEQLTLTGSGHINGTGNALANRLTGNGGNNVLNGGLGDDVLIGGGGNDIYIVDAIGDRVFETTATNSTVDAGGIDTVQSVVSFNLNATVGARFVENLTLTGRGDINGTGNALANRLVGNGGNNVLNGGLGIDLLIGGAGNDVYVVDAVGDRVFETTATNSTVDAGGVDTVQSAVSFNLNASIGARFVENLVLTSSGDINGTGNALANRLVGNDGNNVLNGGLGNDVLIGGAGRDVFVFNSALGAGNLDRVTDFAAIDDIFYLDDAVFLGLVAGHLSDAAFAANLSGMASDPLNRIIYEMDTGRLYFDGDGSGDGAGVHFATLNANLALTATDILVI